MQPQLRQLCATQQCSTQTTAAGWMKVAQTQTNLSLKKLRFQTGHVFPIQCNSPLVSLVIIFMYMGTRDVYRHACMHIIIALKHEGVSPEGCAIYVPCMHHESRHMHAAPSLLSSIDDCEYSIIASSVYIFSKQFRRMHGQNVGTMQITHYCKKKQPCMHATEKQPPLYILLLQNSSAAPPSQWSSPL